MADCYRALPVESWPPADRESWRAACAPSLRLKPGGAVSHLRPASRTGLVRTYGYFQEFCQRTGRLEGATEPASPITPGNVMAFVDELNTRVGSVTRHTYVSRLCRMAMILAPDRDFAWLRQIEASLKLLMRPRSRADRIVDQSRLWALGLALMERAELSADLTPLRRARLYRDGLMIAFLAVCPIRLKNLFGLEVDHQIRKYGSEWWLILDASETKSGRPDERPLPVEVGASIERWSNHWRPLFSYPGNAFWPSTKGDGLAYTYVGSIISQVTSRELGVDVSPHLFRHSAIHTIASRNGAQIGVGSAILQHTDPRTTAIYNTKANSIQAGRALQSIVTKLQE